MAKFSRVLTHLRAWKSNLETQINYESQDPKGRVMVRRHRAIVDEIKQAIKHLERSE